jgi:hypothetical protein
MQNFNVTSASSGPPEKLTGAETFSFLSNLQLKRMKNFRQTFTLLALILMSLGFSVTVFAQTKTLYYTNFGTSNVTSSPLQTGWVKSGDRPVHLSLSTASVSAIYTTPINWSAGANLEDDIDSEVGTAIVTLSGQVNTVGFEGIEVIYGARGTSTYSGSVVFEWSSDGSIWNNIVYSDVTRNSVWAVINGGTWLTLPSGAEGHANLQFRFTFNRPNGNGNYRIDDFTVRGTCSTTLPVFSAVFSGGTSICSDGSTNLTATVLGGYTPYNLDLDMGGGSNTSATPVSVTVSPSGTTSFTASLKDSRGCDAMVSGNPQTVIINPIPSIPTTSSPAPVCYGTQVTVTGLGSSQSPGGVTEYTFWDSENGGNQLDPTNALGTISGNTLTTSATLAAGSYTVWLQAEGVPPSCPSVRKEVTITIIPLPIADAGDASATICASGTYTPTATATNGTISWSNGSGDGSFNDPTIEDPIYTPGPIDISNGTVTLTMTVTGNGPCNAQTDSENVVLNITALPTADAGPSTAEICVGSTYTASATATNGTISWSNGSGDGSFNDPTLEDPVYTPGPNDISSGTVTLTMTVAGLGACIAEIASPDNVVLTINPLPSPMISGTLNLNCAAPTTMLSTFDSYDAYLWSTSATTATITTGVAAGITVMVTDGNGCQATSAPVITVFYPVTNLDIPAHYLTIEAAIAAADNGHTIEICDGTYPLSSSVNVTKDITIQGKGRNNTTVTLSSAWLNNPNTNAFNLNTTGIIIKDIHFQIVGKGQGSIIGIFNSNTEIRDNKFSGEYVYGDGEVTRATVWSASPVTGIVMDNNIIESLRQPGYLSAGSGIISNNTFTTTRGWVIEGVQNLNITGNTWNNNTSHITILTDATNISGLTINNNNLSGTKVDWVIDNRTPNVLNASCNWFGTTDYVNISSKNNGPIVFVPYLYNATIDPFGVGYSCTGVASPLNLSVVYEPIPENIQVTVTADNNDLNLLVIPGNPTLPQITTLYTNLATAVTAPAIQAAALAVGDDIILEYYYYDHLNVKTYLQTAGLNPLIKNKYWQEYLVKLSNPLQRYPNWSTPLTVIDEDETFRTNTNPGTLAVTSGWLNGALGRNVYVTATFIHNGNVSSATQSVAIPSGPVNVYNAEPFSPATWVSSHLTIQAAINAASTMNGYFVKVDAGTYTEAVVINKEIKLLGANANVVCTGSRGPESIINPPILSGLPAISLGAGIATNNVTINGFEITGTLSNSGIYCGGDGPSNLTIRFNNIHHIGTARGSNTVYAINYRVGANNTFNVNISDNCIDEVFNDTNAAEGHSAAIWVGQSNANGVVSNLTIERNMISNVKSGRFDKAATGISLEAAWGVGTGGISGAIVKDNTIQTVSGGIAYGIQLTGKTPNTSVQNNKIDNVSSPFNPVYAVGVTVPLTNTGSATVSINNNSFTNATFAIFNGTAVNLNATCNWYGSASGNVIAPKISGTVNYISWLVNGTNIASGTGFFQTTPDCSGTPVFITSATPSPNQYCQNDGEIDVVFNGGTGTYTVAWTGGSPVSGIAGSPYTITGLANGNYTITVTDINGSWATTSATVSNQPVRNNAGPTYYATIQAAIDAASPGHTIEVCAGTYNERVIIDKSLTLQGVNEANVIINGSSFGDNGNGITINNGVTNVNIRYLTVQNFKGLSGNANGGIYAIGGNNNLLVEHVTIKDNRAPSTSGSGFYANGPVTGVTLDYVTSTGHYPGARGIVIWNGLKSNITISNCHVYNNNCCGIELQDGFATGVTMNNNNVHDNGDSGMSALGLQGPGVNVISNNTVTNNGRFGIEIKNPNGSGAVSGAGSIVVSNNTVSRTPGPVLKFDGITSEVNDLAGICVIRRMIASPPVAYVDVPYGVQVNNNSVSGYVQPSNSDGFGIVLEGINHTATGNTLNGNDVGMQRQAGHLPYPGEGDQTNLMDTYFGRGNSPVSCGINISGTINGNVLANTVDSRDVGNSFNLGIVVNTNTNKSYCSIQSAINDVATIAGHVITVSSGTYNEQVLVNKGVKILGVGVTKPIVDFTGTVTGKPTLFDVSADGVTIENINFNVDLSKLRSAVIASSAGLDAITVKDNMVGAYGTPTGSYGDRNAVSVNYGGSTNYRVATGGVNSVVFTGNTVTGTAPDSYYRSGISVDEGGLTATGNTLTTINHDVLLRFASNGANLISGNTFNGGGVELSDENGGSGTITVSSNNFNGAGAPNTAVLRIKNNYNSIPHVISSNTFTNYDWGVSMENANTVTLDQNTFTTTVTSAHAVTVNTKSLSSNSNTIVQVPVSATMTKNNFNGTGNAITFLNHDSDNDSYGTITIGSAGNENNFSNTLSSFIVFDGQTGTTDATMSFPVYPVSNVPNPGNNLGWPTTKACWDQNLNAQYNNYNVGSGLQLPTAMSFAGRTTLESKLTHDPDIACLGLITYFLPVHNLTQNTYFLTIGAAVAAANTNDEIECSEWTFNEKVIIGKSLTLKGVSETNCIIDGTGLGNGSGITVSNGITGVNIEKFTIRNHTGTSPNSFAGIYAVGGNNNLSVKDCTIKDNVGGSGFYANGPVNTVTLDNLDVSGHPNSSGQARGIVIWNGLKENISITNCNVYDNACCGIELQDGTATGVTISGNTIVNNADNGIGVSGLKGPLANIISGNTITNNGRFGIEVKNPDGNGALSGGGSVVISGNTVTRTIPIVDARDIAGIAVIRIGVQPTNTDVPTGVVVSGNTVTGYVQPTNSDGFGIVIEGTNHKVKNNAVSGNDVGIQQQQNPSNYPGNADQTNLADMFFGRGNSPITCGNEVIPNDFTGGNLVIDYRAVGALGGDGFVSNPTSGETFCSINTAIADAQTLDSHTLNVSAGTFNENVTLTKDLTINGAGPAMTIISQDAACVPSPATIGISISANNATVQNLKVTNFTNGLAVSSTGVLINNVESVSNCNTGLELSSGTTNLSVQNSKLNNNTSSGFRKGTAATVTGFILNNSEVKGNVFGCFVSKNNGAGGTFDNVTITNSNFSNNTQKGMYFEALSNARIDGVTMNASGIDPAYNNNAGIDINLKYANYANDTIQNCDITNSGVYGTATDAEQTASMMIKARNDGVTYGPNPATLSGVIVKNNRITGPQNGIRFGEFGVVNAGPSNVTLEGNDLSHAFANKAVIRRTNNSINLVCNWHGTTILPTIWGTFSQVGGGSINLNNVLGVGTDSNPAVGFQPSGSCTCPSGNLVTNANTSETFCTIQAAIDDADTQNSHVLVAGPGTYIENIVVNKELDIRGANYNVNPNTGSRGTESILMTAIIEVGGSNNSRIVAVDANNVKINGFLLDGNNPALTSGFTNNVGVDMDIRNGIDNAKGIQNLRVENNIIKNMVYYGVRIQSTTGLSPAVSSGHEIHNNRFMDMGTYQTVPSGWGLFGGGVLLQNSHYAKITNNVMLNVRIGVQLGNFQAANPNGLFVQTIDNNQIQARRIGIFYNLLRYSPWIVANNSITGYSSTDEGTIGGSWRGLRITSVGLAGMGNSLFNNNSINGSAISNINKEGINVWNVTNNSQPIITGGSITGVNIGTILVNHDSGFGNAADGANATLNNVNITATGIGVHLLDSPSSSTHAKVNATVSGVTISGGVEGIKLEGDPLLPSAAVGGSFTGNTINAAAAGINVTRATLSGTNPLIITGNGITLTSQVVSSLPTVGIALNNISGTAATIGTNNIGTIPNVAGPYYGYTIYNLNTTPVTNITGGKIYGVMQGVAAFNSVDGNVNFAPSVFNLNSLRMSGFTGNHGLANINFHAGVYTFTGGVAGPNSITANITDVSVNGTGRIAQDCAGLSFVDFSSGSGTMQNIKVRRDTLTENLNRGINIRGNNALIDISTSTLDRNGRHGFNTSNIGFGLIARQGAVVTMDSSFIINPEAVTDPAINVSAIGADPGSAGFVSVTATHNSIIQNTNATSKLVNNAAGGTVNATCNWWESAVAANVTPHIAGVVTYQPFLTTDTDVTPLVAGFQPVPNSCNACISGVLNTNTNISYCTIQQAIDDINTLDDHTITVAAGTYAEQLNIHKRLNILGPNALISPNTGSRVAEAFIVPPSILNLSSVPREQDFNEVVWINKAGVKLKGFTISGDNPDLDGYDYVGMDVEAGIGVYSEGSNVEFSNNIVENFTTMGFWAGGTQSTQYNNLIVDDNKFDKIHDINQLGYGFGMYIQGTAGSITRNRVTNTRNGIQVQPYQVIQGVDPSVCGDNTFSVYKTGIYYNYAELTASPWTIKDNTVTAVQPPANPTGPLGWEGIKTETMRANGSGGTIENNIVNGTGAVSDNIKWWGVYGMRYAGASSTSSQVNFTGNTVSNVEIGFVYDAAADIVFTGNSLSASQKVISVQRFVNSAGVPQATGGVNNINATGGNTYNGVLSTGATLAQLYDIEDQINHKIDESWRGLVQVKANELYVTPASFIAPGTTTPLVQRAIDAATAGFTLNVEGGTYTENVTVNKAVTIRGANFGNEGCGSREDESIVAGGIGTAFNIISNGVTIDGFEITGATGITTSGVTNIGIRNNKILVAAAGVNSQDIATSAGNTLTIEDNCISLSGQVAGGLPTAGIAVSDASGTHAVVMDDNTVTGAFYGYGLYGLNTTASSIVSDGSVNGAMQGIAIANTVDLVTKLPSNVSVSGMAIFGFEGDHPALTGRNFHAGIYTFTTAGTVPAEGITLSVEGSTINGTQTVTQASGGIYLADFSGLGATVQTVTIDECNIIDNTNRGLDARGRVNVTVTESTFTNNGGGAFGSGGNDGFTMIAQQGATINAMNNFITHPATSTTPVTAFLTGNGPANTIIANNNSILKNGNANGRGASNVGGSTIDATCNWWGTTLPSAVSALMLGTVSHVTWLISGVDGNLVAAGFQPSVPCEVCVPGELAGSTISGTAFVIQNAPTTPTIAFTGIGGTSPYTFTYNVSFNAGPAGPTQTVTTISGDVVSVVQSNSVAGTFTYSLLSVTEANGCTYTFGVPPTATITVVANNLLPDLAPIVARPVNVIFVTGQMKEGYVQINNGGNGPTVGPVKFTIPKEIGGFTIDEGQAITMSAGQPVVNSTCTFVSVNLDTQWEITYNGAIPVGGNIRVGFKLTATGFTGTNSPFTVTIITGTGLDSNPLNNKTAPKFSIN